MSNYFASAGRLACEPFETLGIQTQGKTFVTVKQKNGLLRTKVVYPCERLVDTQLSRGSEIRPGFYVYIRGDCVSLPFTREVFDIGDKKVILVPLEQIQAVEMP